jgi:hypothetical protein
MNLDLLIANLTTPSLLFFVLGIIAVVVKSDLEIPAPTVKFISIYLLFSIGFKGGQELSHGSLDLPAFMTMALGLVAAGIIPIYTFFLFKKKLGIQNAGAIAATYGSVSAVTFVAAASFLESKGEHFGGHIVATMALMEAPAIIVAIILMRRYGPNSATGLLRHDISHSLTNGSVLLILGSLTIGLVSDSRAAEGIKPFTTDIFKGFLSIFLLEMGMVTARRIRSAFSYGHIVAISALCLPLVNGTLMAWASYAVTESRTDRFMLCVLAASGSYIAVPAAMKLAAPKADPGLYLPMALGLTFPFNLTFGLPLYYHLTA